MERLPICFVSARWIIRRVSGRIHGFTQRDVVHVLDDIHVMLAPEPSASMSYR